MTGAAYEIRIKGHIGDRLAQAFEGFEVSTETVLRAQVEDQATLHRALEKIRDLGLLLVDVQCVSDSAR
jgi:adenylate kinase family enzyme